MIKRREEYYLGQLGPFIAMYDENDKWVETASRASIDPLNKPQTSGYKTNYNNDIRLTKPVMTYPFNSRMFDGSGFIVPTHK